MPSIMKGETLYKRAHDLAIAYIHIAYENHKAAMYDERVPEDTPFDIYQEYLECYKIALERFDINFSQ